MRADVGSRYCNNNDKENDDDDDGKDNNDKNINKIKIKN